MLYKYLSLDNYITKVLQIYARNWNVMPSEMSTRTVMRVRRLKYHEGNRPLLCATTSPMYANVKPSNSPIMPATEVSYIVHYCYERYVPLKGASVRPPHATSEGTTEKRY